MSNYATVDDVQHRLPQFTLGPDSRPSISTAQEFIDATSAQFDAAMLNLGYVVPITGTLSLLQAKEIVSQGTICKILTARAAAIGTDPAFQSADRACQAFATALQQLADPKSPVELTDAVRTDEAMEKGQTNAPMGLYPLCPAITMCSKF